MGLDAPSTVIAGYRVDDAAQVAFCCHLIFFSRRVIDLVKQIAGI
jgi:hypothetical protein